MSLWSRWYSVVANRLERWTLTEIARDGMGVGQFTPTDGRAFIRPTIVPFGSRRISMHGGSDAPATTETEGIVATQMFFPRGWGQGLKPWEAIDAYQSLWRHHKEDGFTVLEPEVRVVGHDGKFWQVNVSIPFRAASAAVPGFSEGFDRMVISSSGHTFAPYDAIRRSSTGWLLAIGSTGSYADAVVGAVSPQVSFVAVFSGAVESSAHGFAVGSDLWLSTATNGLLSTTQPSGGEYQRVGKAITASAVAVNLERLGST